MLVALLNHARTAPSYCSRHFRAFALRGRKISRSESTPACRTNLCSAGTTSDALKKQCRVDGLEVSPPVDEYCRPRSFAAKDAPAISIFSCAHKLSAQFAWNSSKPEFYFTFKSRGFDRALAEAPHVRRTHAWNVAAAALLMIDSKESALRFASTCRRVDTTDIASCFKQPVPDIDRPRSSHILRETRHPNRLDCMLYPRCTCWKASLLAALLVCKSRELRSNTQSFAASRKLLVLLLLHTEIYCIGSILPASSSACRRARTRWPQHSAQSWMSRGLRSTATEPPRVACLVQGLGENWELPKLRKGG